MSDGVRVIDRIQDMGDFAGSLSAGRLFYYDGGTSKFQLAAVGPAYASSGTLLTVTANDPADVPLAAQAVAGQTASLLELRDENGVAYTQFNASGCLILPSGSATAGALRHGLGHLYFRSNGVAIAAANTQVAFFRGTNPKGIDLGANTLVFGSDFDTPSVGITRSSDGYLAVTQGDSGATGGGLVLVQPTTTTPGLIVSQVTSGTGNLIEARNSSGTALAKITSLGGMDLAGPGYPPSGADPVLVIHPYPSGTGNHTGILVDDGYSRHIFRVDLTTPAGYSAVNVSLGSPGLGEGILFRTVGSTDFTGTVASITNLYNSLGLSANNGLQLNSHTLVGPYTYLGGGPPSPQLSVVASAVSVVALAVQGAVSQTGNLFEVRNSSGTALTIIAADGTLSSPGAGTNSEHFGLGSTAAGANATAFGKNSTAGSSNGVAVGCNASSFSGVAIGGSAAYSAGNYGIAIGESSSVTGNYSVGIGKSVSVSAGGIGLGAGATAGSGQFVVGSSLQTLSSMTFAGTAVTIQAGVPASGAGNSLTLAGSAAVSGNTNGGDTVVQLAAKSGSGTDGNFVIKDSGGTTRYTLSSGAFTVLTAGGQTLYGTDGTTHTFGQNGAGGQFTIQTANSGNRVAFATGGSFFQFSKDVYVLGTTGQFMVNFDTALQRSAAGVFKVTNGSTGSGGFASVANSPAQLTADQNNYAPGVGLFQRWSSDASCTVTGVVAGQAGEFRTVWNVGTQNIVLANESSSSTAANRFTVDSGTDFVLGPGKSVYLQYDATSSRWRVSAPAVTTAALSGTYAAMPAAGVAGRRYLATDSILEFVDSGSAWQGYIPGQARFTIPNFASGWTWENQGATTLTSYNGWYALEKPAGGSSSMSAYYKTAPATPWTLTVCMPHQGPEVAYPTIGIGFRESSSGKYHVLVWDWDTSFAGLASFKFTNYSTFSAAYAQWYYHRLASPPTWLRITDDGTNRKCYYSVNGVTWIQFHSVGRTDFLTADQYALVITEPTGSGPSMVGNLYSLAVT